MVKSKGVLIQEKIERIVVRIFVVSVGATQQIAPANS
jgi:hypothetical protein